MNLRDLKYLIALSDYKHFGKASKACFVSQPALSMQIKKLEDTLGVKLLERTNKSVLLTDIGRTIVQRAREIIIQAEEIREVAKQARDPEHGELRLGILPTLAPYLLPYIFPKLSLSFPRLEIYLVESKTHELLEKLKQGKLDAALLATPNPEGDLIISPLFEETFHLAVTQSHPLAQKTTVQPNDLQQQNLLLLEEGHCLREQALSFCQDANASVSKNFYATSLETLRHMVASNMGITLMPALAQRPEDGITYLSFESPQKPTRMIGMAWRNSCARSVLLKKMAEQIKVILKEARIADRILVNET